MGLLERVGTLIRANLNDLIDRAEDPEKMLKQLVLDMQNQLIQVKTQIAMCAAEQHLLEQKHRENLAAEADWMYKAEVALAKGRDDLAREAVGKTFGFKEAASNYAQQAAEQKSQVEQLKTVLLKLERKLEETRTESDLLAAQHRRARAVNRTARQPAATAAESMTLERMRDKVQRSTALSTAYAELAAMDTKAEIEALEREDRIEQVLEAIRKKKSG